MTGTVVLQPDIFPALPSSTSGSRTAVLLEGLLALGIVLSGASQFRMPGVPLGPGEMCLFGWAALRVSRVVLYRQDGMGGPCRTILLFWTIFGIGQCVGLIRAVSMGLPIDWSLTLHDTTAYVLVALISTFCLSGGDSGASLGRVMRYLLLFAALSLLLQIVSGLSLVPAPGTGPWYWDRFRGWADNPNQLSLFCAVVTALAVFAAESARRRSDRVIAIASALVALTAGIMTKGNTLRLSLAIGACLFIALLFRNLALPRRGRATVPALVIVLTICTIPVVLLSMLPSMTQLSTQDLAQQVSRDSGETMKEADLRFMLWSGAVQQGLDSYYLGLGPGPHAPVPIELTLRRVWETDAFEESLGEIAKHADWMESHNTYVELFSQGGLLVILAFGGLLLRAAANSLSSRSAALPALLIVLVVFGLFHVMLRHPIVWLALCLCIGGRVAPSRPRF